MSAANLVAQTRLSIKGKLLPILERCSSPLHHQVGFRARYLRSSDSASPPRRLADGPMESLLLAESHPLSDVWATELDTEVIRELQRKLVPNVNGLGKLDKRSYAPRVSIDLSSNYSLKF